MDKEQARFILRSFRPDGADAHDTEFVEALALAAEDRELGEWLADERAFDAEFANALSGALVPKSLRTSILNGATLNLGGLPQAETDCDAMMIGALASIQAPASLRGEVLMAMERTVSRQAKIVPFWRKAAWPMAAAAGITLAFLMKHPGAEAITPISANPPNTVPVDVVQASFIRTFESQLFKLDEGGGEQAKMLQTLEKKKLPCPKCLPPGLVGVKGIGCRELVIDGKRGSLVCYDDPENGPVHLVIFKREDVCGDLPTREKPVITQHGPWAVARWVDEGHVFVLLGSTPIEKLEKLF